MLSDDSIDIRSGHLNASDVPVVSAVMPCLNEEKSLASCIAKAQASFRELGIPGEVVIADNGSSDRSIEIAESMGARVVRERRKGYGSALQCGIRESRGKIIVMADADDSYDWAGIAPFVRKVAEGYDLVMGNRFAGGIAPGAMPFLHRYLGNPVLSCIGRIAFRIPIRDFHCGMRAFSRDAYDRMQPKTSGMEFATEMVANAAYQGLKVCEIPTTLQPDTRDRAPHLRSFRDGWRHLRFILTYTPDFMYVLPGLAMLFAGLALLVALAGGPVDIAGFHMGIHFVALGAMLSLIGFNVLNLGVLAKTMLAQRYRYMRSRTVRWLNEQFSLETGLIIGAMLLLSGLAVDAWILRQWLGTGRGAMEDTIHLAFTATTIAVLGLNVVFSSFLLALLLRSDTDRG
jgi:glycosyltransferase involved in cell wall biosynthesis